MSQSFVMPGQPQAPSAKAADGDLVKDTTTRDFRADVLDASMQQTVLVDFWAPWCGPCRQLTPLLEKVVREAKGRVRLVKMNIDEHPAVAGQLGVQSIPAVFAFRDGRPVDGFLGALPESQIRAFIDKVAGPSGPSPAEEMVAAADEALADGDVAGAAGLYANVLQAEPGNVAALGGLAKCLIKSGQLERARQTLAMVPDAAAGDPAVTSARAALELAEQAAALGNVAELTAKVARDPADLQTRFDLALALNARGDKEGAVDNLIEIVRRNRVWNEEAARKQLVQFFEAWGPKDEMTLAGRRRLSSVLFS